MQTERLTHQWSSMLVRNAKHQRIMGPQMEYIGRPSVWGNPYPLVQESNRAACLAKFVEYWYAPEQRWLREKALAELTPDKILCCFCAPKACHGDIIAGYLNWKRS